MLANHLGQVNNPKQIQKERERIIASSEEALQILRTFEEEATGKKLLPTPESVSPFQPIVQASNQT